MYITKNIFKLIFHVSNLKMKNIKNCVCVWTSFYRSLKTLKTFFPTTISAKKVFRKEKDFYIIEKFLEKKKIFKII